MTPSHLNRRQVLSGMAAAAATARIRSTIARNPFDRCDDRCSFSPSRPSSATASTLATSATGRPE